MRSDRDYDYKEASAILRNVEYGHRTHRAALELVGHAVTRQRAEVLREIVRRNEEARREPVLGVPSNRPVVRWE